MTDILWKYIYGGATPFMVINMRSGIKKNYILICFKILNLKGHQSYITGSRVTAIFLNWLIFLLDKEVKLVSGGSVINGAYPV